MRHSHSMRVTHPSAGGSTLVNLLRDQITNGMTFSKRFLNALQRKYQQVKNS